MQINAATTALVATSIAGAGVIGASIGWGNALQDNGNRGGDMAGAFGASVGVVGTFYPTLGAAALLGAARPIAALGAAMVATGVAAGIVAHRATLD